MPVVCICLKLYSYTLTAKHMYILYGDSLLREIAKQWWRNKALHFLEAPFKLLSEEVFQASLTRALYTATGT